MEDDKKVSREDIIAGIQHLQTACMLCFEEAIKLENQLRHFNDTVAPDARNRQPGILSKEQKLQLTRPFAAKLAAAINKSLNGN